MFPLAACVAALLAARAPDAGLLVKADMEQQSEPTSPSLDSTTQALVRSLEYDVRVQRAIQMLRARDEEITDLQIRFAEMPSPDYRAPQRARFLAKLFKDVGLRDVRPDPEGNVIGILPGARSSERAVILSAHLDTVFPELDSLRVERQGSVLRGPGVGDDAAGLAALVHLVRALRDARIPLRRDLVIVGTVGEEGEGDLKGVKQLFDTDYPPGRVEAFITLDLGSHQQIVNEGLGSRRLHVTVTGPGGHSWGDFGRPNPIHALARGIDAFLQLPLPTGARTSFNVGVIEGGRGVNVIPEEASVRMDLRSEAPQLLEELERSFRTALETGLQQERAWSQDGGPSLQMRIQVIGDRPVGKTSADSPLVRAAVAAFTGQGLQVVLGSSSTDANLPMSLGIPALALPHGVHGHNAHSRGEWCDVSGRPSVLAAELVTLVAVAGIEGPLQPGPAPTD